MFLNLLIFILMFSSQAFASTTSSSSFYSQTPPTFISLDSSSGSGIDSNTELMLHLDNNLTDASQNNFYSNNFNVTFSNTSPEFAGTYYGVFNGTTSYLTMPNSTIWNFGTNNFTIDFWLYMIAYNPYNSGMVCWYKGNSPFNDMSIIETSGYFRFTDSNTGIDISTSIQIPKNQWNHMAVVRNGTAFNLYINGVSYANTTSSSATVNPTDSLYIGENGTQGLVGNQYLDGYMAEVRISNIARWTSNFTPPTLPYSSAAMSQIILNNAGTQEAKIWMDGSDSNKLKFDDATATRLTISNGNVGIGTKNPSFLLDVAGPARVQTGFITNGTAPTIGSGSGDCGTSPSVTGNDISGTVTVGSGTNGGQCTVTFSAAKSSTPNCICQDSTTSNLTRAGSQSTTSFVCLGTLTAGDKLVYWCPQ